MLSLLVPLVLGLLVLLLRLRLEVLPLLLTLPWRHLLTTTPSPSRRCRMGPN